MGAARHPELHRPCSLDPAYAPRVSARARGAAEKAAEGEAESKSEAVKMEGSRGTKERGK